MVLDYFNKKIVLREPSKFKVEFVGDKKVELTGIIFVHKARRLLKKGHTAYLAHVVDTKTIKIDPSRVAIVDEYLGVFSEEMNGLPPK